MGRLFEQRERAAEGLFAHDEEARFVARRRGVEALARWAGECMALDDSGRVAYCDRLVDSFVGGVNEDEIVVDVQTDLERAGKPSLVGQVGLVLTEAVAEATLSAHPRPISGPLHGRAHLPEPRKPTLGWSL